MKEKGLKIYNSPYIINRSLHFFFMFHILLWMKKRSEMMDKKMVNSKKSRVDNSGRKRMYSSGMMTYKPTRKKGHCSCGGNRMRSRFKTY